MFEQMSVNEIFLLLEKQTPLFFSLPVYGPVHLSYLQGILSLRNSPAWFPEGLTGNQMTEVWWELHMHNMEQIPQTNFKDFLLYVQDKNETWCNMAIGYLQSHLQSLSEITRVATAMMEREIYGEEICLSVQGWLSEFL